MSRFSSVALMNEFNQSPTIFTILNQQATFAEYNCLDKRNSTFKKQEKQVRRPELEKMFPSDVQATIRP